MANWKYNAIDDLKDYPRVKDSLYNIPDQIRTLEAEVTSIRSVTYDKTPVDGGMSGREFALINNIDLRERLKINLGIAQQKVARIERGLEGLTDNERLVLERFYVNRIGGYVNRLCDETGYEERNIYKIKDTALRKFTLAMFGVTDL